MKLKTYGIKHKEHGLLGFSLHTELWGSLECGADAILVVELEENKSGYYMTWHIQAEVSDCYDYENETLPEIINTEEMGVKFSSWLSRDPKLTLRDEDLTPEDQYCIELWWERNFYPCLDMVVNDLYKKGLIEEGEYVINIDY
jgi:hypothetical protein